MRAKQCPKAFDSISLCVYSRTTRSDLLALYNEYCAAKASDIVHKYCQQSGCSEVNSSRERICGKSMHRLMFCLDPAPGTSYGREAARVPVKERFERLSSTVFVSIRGPGDLALHRRSSAWDQAPLGRSPGDHTHLELSPDVCLASRTLRTVRTSRY